MTSFNSQIEKVFEGYINVNPDSSFINIHKWKLPGLTKKNQKGGIQFWQIGFNGTELITIYGNKRTSKGKDGKLQINKKIVTTNLSERDIQEQAKLQALSDWTYKIKQGYIVVNGESSTPTSIIIPSQIKNIPQTIEYPGPQLAKLYNLQKDITFTASQFETGIAIQPKLDGIRARFFKDKYGSIVALSRDNNPIVHFEEIKAEVLLILNLLPPGSGIDCELYNMDMNFEMISSIARTSKKIHPFMNLIDCYVFDLIILNMTLNDRITLLQTVFLELNNITLVKHLKLVPTNIVYSHEELCIYHDNYVNMGFEGLIARKLAGNLSESYYNPGRNNNMYKAKHFLDDEGIIIDATQGEGSEFGLVIWKIKKDEKEFWCRPRGSYELRKFHYENRHKYLGKKYTYRYYQLTNDGLPICPIGISLRDYE